MKLSRLTRPTLAVFLVAVASAAAVPSPAIAAGTITISGQAAYTCDLKVQTYPAEKSDVTMQMQLTAPATVQPGQTVALRGTMTLQFSEQVRQNTTAAGTTSVDGYSTSVSVVTKTAGTSGIQRADRWQTSPSRVSNPMQVTAPLSFPSFKVPDNATGAVQVGLPQNDVTDNIVLKDSTAKVAFSIVSRIVGPAFAQGASVELSCFLPRENPAIIGSIPVTSAGTVATGKPTPSKKATPKAGSSGSQASGSAASPGSVAASSPVTPTAESATSTGGEVTVDGSTAVPADGSGTTTQVAGAQDQLLATSAPTENQGVYVPTSLLLLAGFGICAISLAYASLTNIRLRNLPRSLEE